MKVWETHNRSNIPDPIRTILRSNLGTNLQALIDACSNGSLQGQIIHILSNRKDAKGLIRAQNAEPPIPTTVHSLYAYKKRNHDDTPLAREQYDNELASLVLESKPDIVVCAGFMHVLTPVFLNPVSEAGIPVINLYVGLKSRAHHLAHDTTVIQHCLTNMMESALLSALGKIGEMGRPLEQVS